MASKKAKPILYRRKREGRTNYKKRLRLLLSGKPRLVLRISNTKICAQIIKFDVKGDLVLLGVDSNILKNSGWLYSTKNLPAAYLTGLKVAQMAKGKFDSEGLVFDTGLRTPLQKGKVYAFLKGALDGGLNIAHGSEEKIFPVDEKISGKDIQDYANNLKQENVEKYQKKFAANLKKGADPTQMVTNFEKVKTVLMK
ncbi:MAG: 50S ribosomal protein L18 [archaeon]